MSRRRVRVRERTFWKRVRRAWPGHALRIEASHGEVEEGAPDVVMSVMGKGGFVELKVWPEPLRPMQLPWHEDAISRGASAWVLCDLGESGVWLGTARQYASHLEIWELDQVRPHGVLLQQALDVIQLRLNGIALPTRRRSASRKQR